MRGTAGRQTWVAGLAIERDAYEARDVPRFDYTFTVPGAFAQYDVTASPHISLSASARLDVHSEYGTFFSPRVSALAHAGRWTSRLSVGTGFFGPTPITEETEAAGLTRLEVRQPVEAERGLSASFDVSRTDGPLSYTATLFASRINDPLHVERSPSYVLSTLPDPTTNIGLELLGTLRKEPFSVTATYTYVQARKTVDAIKRDVPLTPRHSAGLVGMWEAEDVGRVDIEWYYTGRQSLEENPYRAVSEPYMILGLLAEKQFGRIRLFVNGENLTGIRQTRWDPLLLPTRAVDGRWTVDAWAGTIEEADSVDLIAPLGLSTRDVIERAFQLNPAQPTTVRQPIEQGEARIEFEVQLVRVCPTICRPLGGTEFVDDVEVGTDPTTRALARKPYEVGLELQLGRALPLERKEDRLDSELQPRRSCRETEREDDLEFGFARFACRRSLLVDDPG